MDWELIGNILKIIVLAGLGVAGIAAILIWDKKSTTRVTLVRIVVQLVSFAALFYFFTFTVPLLYVLLSYFRSDYCLRSIILRLDLSVRVSNGCSHSD